MSFYDRFVGGHSRLVIFWRKDKVLFDKGIRFVGIEFVIGPSCGVVGDVICYFAQGLVIADDVFIIIALPQFAVEWRPSQLFHPTDVFVGRHGFEPSYHRSTMRPASFKTMALFSILPNKHSRFCVQIVTKYIPSEA
jgi:hypothetical protein